MAKWVIYNTGPTDWGFLTIETGAGLELTTTQVEDIMTELITEGKLTPSVEIRYTPTAVNSVYP
jgi:hypothetical protein